MHALNLLLLLLLAAGGQTGLVKRQTHDPVDPSAGQELLANHTSAMIEATLQNIHRLKNYEERERLERLVTRFKVLTEELKKSSVFSPEGDVHHTNADDNLVPAGDENEKITNFKKLVPKPNGKVAAVEHFKPIVSQADVLGPKSFANPTALPSSESSPSAIVSRRPDQTLNDLSSDEIDEMEEDDSSDDDEDDELVRELQQKAMDPADDNPLKVTPKNEDDSFHTSTIDTDVTVSGEFITAEEKSDEDESVVDLGDEDDTEEQVEEDLKLLNTVISKLRRVKAILKKMRFEGKRRR